MKSATILRRKTSGFCWNQGTSTPFWSVPSQKVGIPKTFAWQIALLIHKVMGFLVGSSDHLGVASLNHGIQDNPTKTEKNYLRVYCTVGMDPYWYWMITGSWKKSFVAGIKQCKCVVRVGFLSSPVSTVVKTQCFTLPDTNIAPWK